MKILPAESSDIPALYRLQLLAFESEAEMIGSRAVPALQETEEEHRADFSNWHTLKLETDTGRMIGAIRYKRNGGTIEVGRLMIHPDYRRPGAGPEAAVRRGHRRPGPPKRCTPVQKPGPISAFTKNGLPSI